MSSARATPSQALSGELRPPRGAIAAGVDPPLLAALGRSRAPYCEPAILALVAPGSGHLSFRALLRDAREQSADLCLPVSTVAAERTD